MTDDEKVTLPILPAASVDHDRVDELGRVAFEAYRRDLFGGDKAVEWGTVDRCARRAWAAAAVAVLAEQSR